MKQFKYLPNKKKIEILEKVLEELSYSSIFICTAVEDKNYTIDSSYFSNKAIEYNLSHLLIYHGSIIEDIEELKRKDKLRPLWWKSHNKQRRAFLEALISKLQEK